MLVPWFSMHRDFSSVLRSTLTLLTYTTITITRARELTDAFAGPNFFRRGLQSSIIVGDYLYIDGGVVQIRTNETQYTLPQNISYSLPLSTSWDPRDVAFTPIEKGEDVANYNVPNLFLSSDRTSFYSFNGDIAGENKLDVPKPSAELWSFTPDGRGRGTWDLVVSADSSIVQSVWAGSATGNSSAYLLGGTQTVHSSHYLYDLGSSDLQSSDGLVTYNMDTGTWHNESITYPYPNGWIWDPQLYYLAGYGNQGLLLSMGGATAPPGEVAGDQSFVTFDTVTIYNTVTKEWRNQTTSGQDIPVGRNAPCSWMANGNGDQLEIFIYGGYIAASSTRQSQANIDLARAIYVLSIPSFTWHKFNYPDEQRARAFFTCTVRNRQMLALGGIEPNIAASYEISDPWPQGIGILDMNEMKWSSSYDSSAGPYDTPQRIKDYISANGRYPQQWEDDEVKAWFTGLRLVDDTNSTGSTPPTASPSSSSSPSGSKSSSNTGVIAGGVVGGVVGALLIAGLAWYVLRRRRRSPSTLPEQHSQPGYEKAELESKQRGPGEELSADSKDYGNANGQGRELSGKPVMEMEGSPAQYELPDKGKR